MYARMLIPSNKQEVRKFAAEMVLQFLRLAPDNADMINLLPFVFDLSPFNEAIKDAGGTPAKLKYDLSRQSSFPIPLFPLPYFDMHIRWFCSCTPSRRPTQHDCTVFGTLWIFPRLCRWRPGQVQRPLSPFHCVLYALALPWHLQAVWAPRQKWPYSFYLVSTD